MPIELKIPAVGESITEVQISQWLKAEGDTVQKDEPLAVIDSEKTSFELPAPANGRLAKIVHPAGATVAVGQTIGELAPGEAGAPDSGAAKPVESKKGKPQAQHTPQAQHQPEEQGTDQSKPEPPSSKATAPRRPAVEPKTSSDPLASPNGLAETTPAEPPPPVSPPETRPEDGKARVEPKPAPSRPPPDRNQEVEAEEEIVPMTMLRRTIARRLVEAQQVMAMLTTFNEVDMETVQQLRQQHQDAFQKRYGVKLGVMSFFVKAAIDALKQFPQLNAEVRQHDVVYRNYFDIGVAVATERGLVVPVLRRAERLSFADLERAIADFAQRARENALNPEDLDGGTFTITNGGVFGSMFSTPIINPPQTGILGLHAIEKRPVARGDQVVIRPMMYLALTYDHRIVDGREAVLFLRRVKDAVENPVRMLVEV